MYFGVYYTFQKFKWEVYYNHWVDFWNFNEDFSYLFLSEWCYSPQQVDMFLPRSEQCTTLE